MTITDDRCLCHSLQRSQGGQCLHAAKWSLGCTGPPLILKTSSYLCWRPKLSSCWLGI